MASAVKITSAFGASVLALSVLMTAARAQDVSSAQTCETASLNNTDLTPPSFAQEDFVAISVTLGELGLLEGELIDDLLQKSVTDPQRYDEQREAVMEYRFELEKHLSGEYADADSFDDYNRTALSSFATKLEDYLLVLESLYADNPDVRDAFASITTNRDNLKRSLKQPSPQGMGLASCEQPGLPKSDQKNYGESNLAPALS